MAKVLSRESEQFVESPAKLSENSLMLSNYRVRRCKSDDVPIVTDYYGMRQTEIVLIDLPTKKTDEEQVESDTQQEGYNQSSLKQEQAGGDGPLIFSFLSLAKLEEQCSDGGSCIRQVVLSGSQFDCNPLECAQAFGLRNRLISQHASLLDKDLVNFPVWIAANAEDNLGTTFLGFHSSGGKLNTFHTRCLGCFSEDCEKTLQNLRQRFGDGFETRSKALALYNILGQNVSSAWGPGRLLAAMSLTFKWEAKPEHYLCTPSPSATAVFHFSPGWKDKRVALLESTEELEYLLLMACVLDSDATMVWPAGDENTKNTIIENVRQLISQYRVQNSEVEDTMQGKRHVDFTELLWDILKKCPDFETLVAALNLVFDALKQCRINAILHEDNKSTVARLIRDAQSSNLMLPRLEKLTSIQILLEIGVERFRRDMAQSYISAGFMTNDTDLDFKPQPNALPEERARALLPLHLALQTMLEIKRHLALPPHLLTTMTRSVVSKYCSQPIGDITKVFYETAVPLIHVQSSLLQKHPDLWSNETVYSHGNATIASTFVHFTRDPKLRHLEGRTVIFDQEAKENEELEKRSAFLCTYTTTNSLTAEDMEEWTCS